MLPFIIFGEKTPDSWRRVVGVKSISSKSPLCYMCTCIYGDEISRKDYFQHASATKYNSKFDKKVFLNKVLQTDVQWLINGHVSTCK